MGVKTRTTKEAESSVPPSRLFKAFCLESYNLFPKLFPESIKNIRFIEGDRMAVGCVKQVTFAEGQGCKYAKYRVDGLDEESFYLKYAQIQGGMFEDHKIECIVSEIKFEVSASGRSICKVTTTIHTNGDTVMDEEKLQMEHEKKLKMVRVVEEYLIANPQAYA